MHVIGKNAPALTVASLAMSMTRRPQTVPMPVTTPAAGTAPFPIHPPGRPQPQLEQRRTRIEQAVDAFAGGEASLGVLAFDGPLPAAGADLLLFAVDAFDQLFQSVAHTGLAT